MKDVFTTGEVCKICKVSHRIVCGWFDSGKLQGYCLPGSRTRRYPREYLIRFLREHGMPLGGLGEDTQHKVLVLGAEKRFLDRLHELLPEAEGYQYALAQTGFEAGILVGSFSPDTIIIDSALGRAESLQITHNLRKAGCLKTLIIGLASEDEATPEEFKKHGFNEVFKRPFEAALLAILVRKRVAARQELSCKL